MRIAADLQVSTEGPAAASSPSVSVELTVSPVVSYALAAHAVPVVSRLVLAGSASTLRGGVLRLSVRDAQGDLGPTVERLVDLEAGRSTVLDDVGLTLDPATLCQGQESRPGWVHVELAAADQVLAEHRVPVTVLGAAQWLAAPLPTALEVLAAHVQPQHPAVHTLVAEAAALLEEGTGSDSLTGYADGPERVDEVVEAITWAVRRREVRHRQPSAGWTASGHQVRDPGEVLDGRAGTCLDTVVTLAAALEHAHLRPLLWVVEGHAFLGYWREERSAETAATTEVTALVDQVDRGLIGLVETTLLTDRGNTTPDLHGPAYTAWLSGDLSRVLGVTDVHRARLDGIRPLAGRTGGDGGTQQEPTQHPAEVPAPTDEPAASATDDSPPVPPRVQQWTDALLDLSPRNRLLDLTEGSGLPLAVPHDALTALADLVTSGATLTLLPNGGTAGAHAERGVRVARDLPPQQLLTEHRSVHVDVPRADHPSRLRALDHRARTVVEETGANALYLALGSLVWEVDGRPLRSPVVLVPVLLTPAGPDGGYRLTVDETGNSVPNACLLEQLRRVHGLTVPGLAAAAEDGADVDLATTLQALGEALAAAALPHRVEATADLAVLPVAAHRLWRDLDEHWAEFASSPLLAHLAHSPTEAFADPAPAPADPIDLDELAAQCPLPSDAAQLRAVAEAAAGGTFVLEGPPGTGKSQTIANLVTRAVAEGKRVLVVAGKRAALDVLARRLDAVGMGPFALDLHDKGSRPAVVRAQIRAALEHAVDVDAAGLAADAEELRSARRSLQRYAEQLHADNPAGLSCYSARTAVLAAGSGVDPLPVTVRFAARATAEVVTEVRRALALLPDIAGLARPSAGHAWAFIDTIEVDITEVQQAAVAVDSAIRELPGEGGLAAVLRATGTPEDLDALVHLLGGPRISLAVLDEVRTPRWSAATDDLLGEIAALVAAPHPGLDAVTPAALDLPLADLFVQAQEAAAASWVARRGKLTAVRDQLTPVARPGSSIKPGEVPELTAALRRLQTAVQGLAARAAGIPGLQVPPGWNPFTEPGRSVFDAEVRWLRRAAATVDGATGFPAAVRRFLTAGPVADAAGARTVARLRDALRQLLTVCSSDSARLAAWSGEDGLVLRWTMTRPERGVEYVHPMSLRRWVSLLDTLEPLRLAGLSEARLQLLHGAVPADDAVHAFDRGLAEASVGERQQATGLDAFDAGLHERTVARFAAASRAVRSHLVDAVPAGVLAARSFDAAAADGQVGALRRELAEQGRGLGVRGLLTTYGDLITAVLPCVLASPESVARFFPAVAGQFDLVVFDEASQLRLADAVGALGRARAAVVVGDSEQLPPASPGDPAGIAEEGQVADESRAEESILSACVQAGVPRQWLSWHYRSQDESLIAFSNAHHYGNRLSSFPAPVHTPASAAPDGHGISLVQVAGTFLRFGPGVHTNPVEARAVVAEVLRRFSLAATAIPSIAVITVNAPQRTLIEELLRDSGDERVVEALDSGDGLVVKDVGHVQGDERDVVLLSLGFSADVRGRVPLDLGPLSRSGGERRLNVAVTRARRQVVVFSSFAPEQLPAGQTASVGVQRLRAYLDLAARGTDALPRTDRSAELHDAHRDEVAAELRARGMVVRTDVGLSDFRIDLTVAHGTTPDAPVLAVLLDGPEWARRRTVGDRDGLPVEVLGGLMHWPAVERVWLPTWLADRETVLTALEAAVEAASPAPSAAEPATPEEVEEPYDGPLADVIPLRPLAPRPALVPKPEPAPEPVAVEPEPVVAEPEPEPVVVEPEPAPVLAEPESLAVEPVVVEPAPVVEAAAVAEPVAPQPAEAAAAAPTRPVGRPTPKAPARVTRAATTPLDEEQPFIPWAPRQAGDKRQLDRLTDPTVARLVRRVLTAGIKAEGPVHRDRLTRLTAAAFGLSRVTEARRDAVLALLPATAVDGDFLWPASIDRETWSWFRRQDSSTDRPLDQVAPQEIANAMVALCRARNGLSRDELQLRTLEVFGHRRRTAALVPLLDAVLTGALASGRLTEQPSGRITV
ncbi:DUF4011 domain-containing protein [Modestobacter sp. VKM Ac-2984]|uniref:DUF4011 domain-containing protein n=1 Tax=Modestobacter sp. VKM Ac-2984 TaxID=3004138 RepID=UPI0022AA9B88|nr:DUF4011 domain-containing protein [Modestobacter sp. VKM Ac-2984]MCZ2818614.1 DUF4011 domain-containing protein [Modestobacter sp. VKM Ac-2984]